MKRARNGTRKKEKSATKQGRYKCFAREPSGDKDGRAYRKTSAPPFNERPNKAACVERAARMRNEHQAAINIARGREIAE